MDVRGIGEMTIYRVVNDEDVFVDVAAHHYEIYEDGQYHFWTEDNNLIVSFQSPKTVTEIG